MYRARYNPDRLRLYEHLFDSVLEGKHSEPVAINLLIDIRWLEVPRALASCILDASARGPIRPLEADFAHLVSRAAQLAFGTCEHSEIPSWYLQNHESFLASCLHKLLAAFVRKAASPLQMHRAFAALIDVAGGLKAFLGLSHLSLSTGAHALMTATAHSRFDFLTKAHCNASAAALCFAELLAERILEEPVGTQEADSPLHFFARSTRWQAFAKACIDCFSPNESFAQLQRQVKALDGPKKQAPGLFFLASAFLDADANEGAEASAQRPKSPTRAAAASVHTTPIKVCRSAIRKRSAPFVKLVRRLLAPSKA